MDAIDQLLAELQAESSEVKPAAPQPKPDIVKPLISSLPTSISLVDKILADVKADVAAQDAAQELRKQQELEQVKVKRLETLTKRAKEWLENLDPFSPEGLWFEEFAAGYPSKLDAAIEYLNNNEST